jgi:ribosome-binding ATPase
MSLSVGIAGLPNVGKTTLLNALTHAGAEASNYPFCTIDQNVGTTPVPDADLQRLAAILSPPEVTPATIQFVDIAGLVPGASRGEGLGNKLLAHIREVDAILHVVRCFTDPNVAHTTGVPDPVHDLGVVETEFLLADLDVAERGLQKWSHAVRTGSPAAKEEAAAFERAADALRRGTPIRSLDWSSKERAILADSRFLSAKPCLYVANTGEADPLGRGPLVAALRQAQGADRVLAVCVRVESEIAELPPEEQRTFLAEMGLQETALDLVIAACWRLLDLITFYTIANEKLRAWQLCRGGTAVQAAAKIHTDMAAGFIRAEALALADLLEWKDRQALHDRGLIHTVGRDYVVQDKDVLQILFKA